MIFLTVFAVVFLVVLFLIKNKPVYKSTTAENNKEGLSYKSEVLEDLVNKDGDGDGIPDWQESLWGTDPTKKETTPGIPDAVAIEKLKAEQNTGTSGQANAGSAATENLTQTDKFSRELFTTVAAVSQNGQEMDQDTINKLGSTLAEKIQNSAPRKVFVLADLRIIKNNTPLAIKKYGSVLESIYQKRVAKYTVMDVLQKFGGDGENVDVSVLIELDPIIKDINGFINGMLKMETPDSISALHLNVINKFQVLVENLNDIKLYDTDVIIALGAISQYQNNADLLESAVADLANAIDQKLKN